MRLCQHILFYSLILVVHGASAQSSADVITIGFSRHYFTNIDELDAKVAIELWARHLAKKADPSFSCKVIFLDDQTSLRRMLDNKELHLLKISSVDFLSLADAYQLFPAYLSYQDPTAGETYVLLVRQIFKESGLKGLKNRRFILPEHPGNPIAMMWLEVLLRQAGFASMHSYFDKTMRVRKEKQAVLKVFFEQGDACVVQFQTFIEMIKLNPQISERLSVMEKSPMFIRDIFAVTPHTTTQQKKIIEQLCLSMDQTEAGKTLLTLLHHNRIRSCHAGDLDTVKALLHAYNQWQN